MKVNVLSAIVAIAISGSALAATPQSYDTKFNVSANVPDSAMITGRWPSYHRSGCCSDSGSKRKNGGSN